MLLFTFSTGDSFLKCDKTMKRANIPAFIIIAFGKLEQMKWSVYYVILFSIYAPVHFILDYYFFFQSSVMKKKNYRVFFPGTFDMIFSISDF